MVTAFLTEQFRHFLRSIRPRNLLRNKYIYIYGPGTISYGLYDGAGTISYGLYGAGISCGAYGPGISYETYDPGSISWATYIRSRKFIRNIYNIYTVPALFLTDHTVPAFPTEQFRQFLRNICTVPTLFLTEYTGIHGPRNIHVYIYIYISHGAVEEFSCAQHIRIRYRRHYIPSSSQRSPPQRSPS